MLGTMNCVYETPCGWCVKFDKECEYGDRFKNKQKWKECTRYQNGKCLGTKELDPCKKDKCNNMRFK